jgi:membrane protein
MLAVFPAITSFVSIYGLLADPGDVTRQFAGLKGVIPAEAWYLIDNQLQAVASSGDKSLGIGAAVGLLIALWSSGAGIRALMSALNIAYREHERRSFVTFYGTAFLFTMGIVFIGLFSLGVIVVVPVVLNLIRLGALTAALVKVLPWLTMAVVIMLALGALYRYGASRRSPKTRWVSAGAMLATLLWLLSSLLFSFYVANFASYNQTYGSLGAVVILLMWFWISAYIVLLGAELNAEMEHQTGEDTTEGRTRPLGERGAYVADHVGHVP